MVLNKNKRYFIIAVIVFSVLLPMLSLCVHADTTDNGTVYELSEDGTYIIVTGISENFFSLEIPSEINGIPVKEIAESAFQNNTSLYKVVIPDSVDRIGEAAFRNCRSLVSVRLPASLESIPFECFRDCNVLSDISLPDNLQKLDDQCFFGCTKLGKLHVPASVSFIGYDVFMNCESIRLDTKDNAYAKTYADQNCVNTDFEGTSAYFFLMMLAGCAVLSVVIVTVSIFIKKRLKK